MLVVVDALGGVVFLKAIAFEVSQERRLYGNLILADYQSLALADRLVKLVPRMLLDLIGCQSLVRVCFQNFVDQVDTVGRESLRHLELATENFLVQLRSRLVFEGEVSGHHREEDDSTGPDVNARSMVLESVDHLRCCVAGRPTGCLKQLSLFVSVAEAKIDEADVFLVVKQQVLRLEVPVDYAKLVEVLDATDDLLEELAGLHLLQLLLLDDVVEKFATTDELHDEEQLLGRLDDFEKLDDVGVSDHLENVDLSGDSQHVSLSRDLALLENFDCHLPQRAHLLFFQIQRDMFRTWKA